MANIKPDRFDAYRLSFDGALLRRGFWIYVYRVTDDKGTFLYVGRTGDNASPFAASPFLRLGRHLDLGKKATANTLTKRLVEQGLHPDLCQFELIALGPIFPEQKTMPRHKPYRDAAAHLESALATALKQRGHCVLGKHPKAGTPDPDTLDRLVKEVVSWLKTKPSRRGQ